MIQCVLCWMALIIGVMLSNRLSGRSSNVGDSHGDIEGFVAGICHNGFKLFDLERKLPIIEKQDKGRCNVGFLLICGLEFADNRFDVQGLLLCVKANGGVALKAHGQPNRGGPRIIEKEEYSS